MSDLVHVKGLRELQAFLTSLPAKLEANVMRAGLRAGAKPVRDAARANLLANGSVKSGRMRKNIKISTRSKRGVVSARVRVNDPAANWVEHGTAAHQLKPNVMHPGARPKPFLRPALDSQAQNALVAVGNHIKNLLSTKHGLDTSGVEVVAE